MRIILLPKRLPFFPLLCAVLIGAAAIPAFAQPSNYIDGTVTAEAGGQPLPNCSVYFNNTSNGDITNADGAFKLKNPPQGKYQLVISAIGYETLVIPVSSDHYPNHLNAKLKIKASDLSAVTIQPFLADGWEKYGDVFLRAFIGLTLNASSCKILSDLDSLLTTNGDGSKSLFFHDKLKILYQPRPTDKLQQSEVYLVTPEPIVIEKNGSYYSPREFFVMDRWAQYEKLANALPLDYNPD